MVIYGQGIKTAKGRCTIMSFPMYCNPLPYFSNPNLSYDGEKLGDDIGDLNYNVKWIRANRLLLKAVGTEDKKCEGSFRTGNSAIQGNLNLGMFNQYRTRRYNPRFVHFLPTF